jgi:hypothetical protein
MSTCSGQEHGFSANSYALCCKLPVFILLLIKLVRQFALQMMSDSQVGAFHLHLFLVINLQYRCWRGTSHCIGPEYRVSNHAYHPHSVTNTRQLHCCSIDLRGTFPVSTKGAILALLHTRLLSLTIVVLEILQR